METKQVFMTNDFCELKPLEKKGSYLQMKTNFWNFDKVTNIILYLKKQFL